MSALKRLKVEDDDHSARVSWRNPQYADWKLTWKGDSPSEAKSWDAHRCIIAGGMRPAHFFVGAAREGAYERQSTELSVLLPQECRDHLERALDFIYGEPLGEISVGDAMPLMKIADVLQCRKLQNALIDYLDENCVSQSGNVEVLLRDACKLQLVQVAESLVNVLPASRLTALDFDLLEVDSPPLMRVVAQRLARARMTQWSSWVGHGEVTADGGLAIALPNAPGELSRKGYWCHALSGSQLLAKQQSWTIRVDHVRPIGPGEAWNMAFGVVSGRRPSLASRFSDFSTDLFYNSFQIGACAEFGTGYDTRLGTDGQNMLAMSRGDARWVTDPGPHDNLVQYNLRSGDTISVSIVLPDDGSLGAVEWKVNSNELCAIRKQMPRVGYSLFVELFCYKYELGTMGVTLLEHECK